MNDKSETPFLQQVLGDAWHTLPGVLQRHYGGVDGIDQGSLNVSIPILFRPFFYLLGLLGVLVAQTGTGFATRVVRFQKDNRLFWQRSIAAPANKPVEFNSQWILNGGGEFTEFVNPLLGLRMVAHTGNHQLRFEGRNFLLRLGRIQIPIPEWLALGHSEIVETAVNDSEFDMVFTLTHPLFGEIYRYWGRFSIV